MSDGFFVRLSCDGVSVSPCAPEDVVKYYVVGCEPDYYWIEFREDRTDDCIGRTKAL